MREENHRLREENQALRDEVARLKKQKTKPKIGPSKLTKKKKKKRKRGRNRRGGKGLSSDKTVVVKAKDVPEGSEFKEYANWTVQELVIKAETTLYRVEKWLSPEGELITGQLPAEAAD